MVMTSQMPLFLDKKKVLGLRMERLFFTHPAAEQDYDRFFGDISPVPTIGWCEPGRPPTLPPHAAFDDDWYNADLRARREILKGRFGGRVAYVRREDLELYACLYQKPLARPTAEQLRMLELIEREGPLNIGLIKEYTGLLVKHITPILHRLQEAFLLYEDQVYNEGDRGWYIFAGEFPEVNLQRYTKEEALERIIPRFASRHVFFDAAMAAGFYNQPLKAVQKVLEGMAQAGALQPVRMDEANGYCLPADMDAIAAAEAPKRGVIMLQRNDFLVKSLENSLKEQFTPPSPFETLYYLLIDGEIQGALYGRFKFGPHVLENVHLTLPPVEQAERKDEVMDALYTVFDRTASPLRCYGGEPLL